MKQIIPRLWLGMIMLCLSISASAFDFSIDGIYYNILDIEKQTVEVTYATTNYNSYKGDVKISPVVQYDNKTYSVISIGSSAFFGCSRLTSVTIPNSVISIGANAFEGCSRLTSVIIPNSVTSIGIGAFHNCSRLKKSAYPKTLSNPFQNGVAVAYEPTGAIVEDGFIFGPEKSSILFAPYTLKGEYTIPNSVTSIGSDAFHVCGDLTSVTIPNSVTSIGGSAFYECSELTSVTIPNSVASIGSYAFAYCRGLTSVTIPNSVTSIGSYAFYHCSVLTSVTIPNSVTSIGDYEFYFCSGLTSVTIPNSVTSIGASAFAYCSGLISVIIPNSVTSIGASAFYGCSGLTSVIIPNSVTSIGTSAFYGCSGLTSVIIPNSVKSIGSYAFTYCRGLKKSAYPKTLSNPFGSEYAVAYEPTGAIVEDGFIFGPEKSSILFAPYTLKGEYTIPNSVTSIGGFAFAGCSGLTSVIIPNSVTSIEWGAFYKCSCLTSVIIPNSVTSIGGAAFSGCSGLTSVIIPNSVTSIGDYEFYFCSGLTSITIPNSVTSIGASAFASCSGLTSVTIPNSVASIGVYAFSGCSGLTSVIIGNSVTSIEVYAFSGCSGLTSVILGNSVTSIGDDAFYGCVSLKDVITQATEAPSISVNTFDGVYSKATLSVPKNSIDSYLASYWMLFNSLKFIGEDGSVNTYSDGQLSYYLLPLKSGAEKRTAFVKKGDYKSITSVVIPEIFTDDNSNRYYITGIGYGAFEDCTALKEVKFNTGCIISTIGDAAFLGTAISSIELPSTVTSIGNYAFYYCRGLTSVTIPNSVTSIGNYAFQNCSGLPSVTISNSVTSIGKGAFSQCGLTEVVVPPSVETIGRSAFAGNSGLNKIAMGYKVKTIEENAFQGANADRVFITAQVPPNAPVSTFSRYAGKLYVQGNAAVNAYYDASSCWDRFDVYTMSEPQSFTMEKPKTVEGKAGEQFTLKATLTPANVDLPYVFWRSTDPLKAYVDNEGKVTVLQNITADDNVEIIAETLYYNGPIAKFSFSTDSSGVDEIVDDTTSATSTIDVYTLQGVQVLRNATQEEFDRLDSGIYIVRNGKNVKKVVK